ncbi:hypothetical protein PVK06_027982 [Gossypium arboreum]|uniref:Uncharacterized protein n=1 Tax=Gossypium arboreum TaxID=29729 RepID=A0ABR0P3Z1_GOSAR|nr:hypothetical protein PVK06_027982 [Gossypium arboreum]
MGDSMDLGYDLANRARIGLMGPMVGWVDIYIPTWCDGGRSWCVADGLLGWDCIVSDNEKEEESRNIEECLRKIDNLFGDGIFADQEDTVVEKEVVATEEEVVAEEEEKVVEKEKEKEEEDSVEKTVSAPESVGANIYNLE